MIRPWLAVGILCFGAMACTWLSGASDLEVDGARTGSSGTPGSTSGDPSLSSSGAPVFFVQLTTNGDEAQIGSVGVVSSRGGLPRTIGCPSLELGQLFGRVPNGLAASGANGPYRFVSHLARTFEAEDGARSVFIVSNIVGETSRLVAMTSQTDCAGAPAIPLSPADSPNILAALPRVSPNGQRVAYFEAKTDGFSLSLVTVGLDGKDRRVVRDAATNDAGPNPVIPVGVWAVPPVWINNDELLWVESATGAPPLAILSGRDTAASTPTSSASCGDALIEQLEIFQRDGAGWIVSVASPTSWQGGNGSSDVRVTRSDQSCAEGKSLTNDSSAGNAARDVAVSPDGRLIAFTWNASTNATDAEPRSLTSPNHVWLVDSLGGSPPIACSALDDATDDFGPQWVERGAKLVFSHSRHDVDFESLMIADVVDGKCANVRPLLVDDRPEGTRYLAPANASVACAMSSRSGSSLALAFVAAIAGALTVRRRQRG